MSVEPTVEQDPKENVLISTPFPESVWGKLLYGLFIVIMPILAFWATDLFKPEWQTGRFADYLILLLFPEASILFFFLIAYSIVSYCLLLIDPARFGGMHIVRFGVYTGVLLAFQYSILAGLFFLNDWDNLAGSFLLIALWTLPLFVPKIHQLLADRWGSRRINSILGGLAGAIFLVSAVFSQSPLVPIFLVLAALTIASPFWCLFLTIRAARWLLRKYEFRLTVPRGLGIAAWIAGYIAAWRFDILKMYELYAALPPEPPPDCYIATAAAQGHPRFVGSWTVGSRDHMQINEQLQIFKCAELALMAVQPRLHRGLRKVYDRVGRILAKRIQNPFLADLAYLFLKPWEWLARLLLGQILPDIDQISKEMYVK